MPLIFIDCFGKFESMTIQQIVGDNIRHIREQRHLSQEALGWDAKMSRAYIGKVERAQRSITIVRLAKLAKALGVKAEVLLIPEYYRRLSEPSAAADLQD